MEWNSWGGPNKTKGIMENRNAGKNHHQSIEVKSFVHERDRELKSEKKNENNL